MESCTRCGEGRGNGFGLVEIGLDGLRALDEGGERRIMREGLALWNMHEVGHREWWDRELLLARDVQDGTTGHQQLYSSVGLQQLYQEWGSSDHLLEVVQQQQQVLLSQIRLQVFHGWSISRFP